MTVGEDLDAIKAAPFPGTGRTVAEQLTHLVATIGENMNIRRARVLSVGSGVVATYVHNALQPGPGQDRRAGRGRRHRRDGGAGDARPPGRHAYRGQQPRGASTSTASIPPRWSARRRCWSSRRAQSGRPDNIIEKMVEGRIRKFYEEVVLLEQVWVHDGESRVKAVLAKAGVKLAGFARFKLGEGIDTPQRLDPPS